MSKSYQPPNRNLVYKDLLGVTHDQNMERNLSLIKKESDIFGLLFLGDSAAISIIPILNLLVSRNISSSCIINSWFLGKLSRWWRKGWNFYM